MDWLGRLFVTNWCATCLINERSYRSQYSDCISGDLHLSEGPECIGNTCRLQLLTRPVDDPPISKWGHSNPQQIASCTLRVPMFSFRGRPGCQRKRREEERAGSQKNRGNLSFLWFFPSPTNPRTSFVRGSAHVAHSLFPTFGFLLLRIEKKNEVVNRPSNGEWKEHFIFGPCSYPQVGV